MKTLEMALGERSYPIHIGTSLLPQAGELLAGALGRRAVIVTNAAVATHHLAPLRAALARSDVATEVILVPDGEAYKAWPTLHRAVRNRHKISGCAKFELWCA